ncbi:MAG: hypothetical protein ACJ79Y_12540 [Myxococcales bacterium]
MRAGALALLLLAFGCSHNNERPKGTVGAEPTPFVLQNGTVGGAAAASGGSDKRTTADSTSGVTPAEREREHRPCEIDADCEGRLRCVSYRGMTGREIRQCLFSCLDGCPQDYTCQMHVADGPSKVCEQSR